VIRGGNRRDWERDDIDQRYKVSMTKRISSSDLLHCMMTGVNNILLISKLLKEWISKVLTTKILHGTLCGPSIECYLPDMHL
jgi:hypothetical protein